MDLYLGARGATYVSGTQDVTGNFFCLYPLSDCVFTTLVAPDVMGDDMTTLALPAGVPIYATVFSFTLASGTLLAYVR